MLRLAFEGKNLFRVSADGRKIPAEFYEGIPAVHPAAAKRFEAAYQQRKKDMLYTDYFPQTVPIRYRRSNGQAMSLPFGVDENGEVQYLTFENLDFSAYLLGQSGSGKSTLFHMTTLL